jgi:hypothetical protein
MADRDNPHLLEVVGSQPGQNLGIKGILVECRAPTVEDKV